MPVYPYVCDECGHHFDIVASMRASPAEEVPCGATGCAAQARRDYRGQWAGAHAQMGVETFCDHNPHTSVAAEVDPSQIASENAFIESHGIKGVRFRLSDDGFGGEPVATSKRGWKDYCERRGYFNKDGGFGDAQKGSSQSISSNKAEMITIDF